MKDLKRLARILGVSVGEGYARAMAAMERAAEAAAPPTRTAIALQAIERHLAAWSQEAARTSRVGLPAQAKLLNLVKEWRLAAMDESAGEEQQPPG